MPEMVFNSTIKDLGLKHILRFAASRLTFGQPLGTLPQEVSRRIQGGEIKNPDYKKVIGCFVAGMVELAPNYEKNKNLLKILELNMANQLGIGKWPKTKFKDTLGVFHNNLRNLSHFDYGVLTAKIFIEGQKVGNDEEFYSLLKKSADFFNELKRSGISNYTLPDDEANLFFGAGFSSFFRGEGNSIAKQILDQSGLCLITSMEELEAYAAKIIAAKQEPKGYCFDAKPWQLTLLEKTANEPATPQ